MTGWLVMTPGPWRGGCTGWSFWTVSGLRGRSDGCALSPPWFPRPPSGPGTGLPAAGGGPWQRGQALLASGWWRGPWHRSAGPGRVRQLATRAWRTGPSGRRDGYTHGPPAISVRLARRFPCSVDGHRRSVGPAPPAAADGARDRRGNPERRVLCRAGGVGRAAAQAEDRRGSALGAAGSVARLRAAAAEPLR